MAQRDPRSHRSPIRPGRRARGPFFLIDAREHQLTPGREYGFTLGEHDDGGAPHAEAEGLVRAETQPERGQRARDVVGDPGAAGAAIGTAILVCTGGSARTGARGGARGRDGDATRRRGVSVSTRVTSHEPRARAPRGQGAGVGRCGCAMALHRFGLRGAGTQKSRSGAPAGMDWGWGSEFADVDDGRWVARAQASATVRAACVATG